MKKLYMGRPNIISDGMNFRSKKLTGDWTLDMEACRFPAAGPLRFPFDPVSEKWSIGRPSNLRFCSSASAELRLFGNGDNQGTQNRMFILGLGFVGEFVAQDHVNQGW